MFFPLSLALLSLLSGANALPADKQPRGVESTTPAETILARQDVQPANAQPGSDAGLGTSAPPPAPSVDPASLSWTMSPPEQQFLLQVRFIQDRSSGSGLFNETTPTFLNFAKWARASQKPKDEVPVPGEDWEVFGDITRAAHFQDHTGWIWYSGWPNASAAGAAATTVKTRSARMLIANLTSGKLVLGSDEFTTSRWAFTPTGDYLVLRNGTDPKMRLCRSADGVQASSPGARPENFGAQPGSVGVKARNALAQAEMPVAASRQGAPTNMQNTPTANQVLPTANQNAPATNPDTLPVSVQADGPATAGQFTILLGDAAVAAGMRCQNIRLQRQVATNTSQPVTDLSTFRAGGTPNPSS